MGLTNPPHNGGPPLSAPAASVMVMEQRISAITLGVADLDRARRFYERLGWAATGPTDEVVFFQVGGFVLALWGRADLAADSGVSDSGGWGGITLAHNVRSREEVDSLLDSAEREGGSITVPAGETDWGGYHGVFADVDGHRWEVAHNPFWRIDDDGRTLLE